MRLRSLPLLVSGLLLLAGCGDSSGESGASGGAPADGGSSASDAVLTTADSEFGEIVVDAEGRTVYVFDRDTAGSGSSACTDQCLENWPAVVAGDADPAVHGVTGDVGTIERADGTMQVTLAGRPLYTYVGDGDAGDVTGQGVQDVWWVVGPDGTAVTGAAPSPAY